MTPELEAKIRAWSPLQDGGRIHRLTATPFFDSTCELCGLHRVTVTEPQSCNRCGSLQLTIFRIEPKSTGQETYDIRA